MRFVLLCVCVRVCVGMYVCMYVCMCVYVCVCVGGGQSKYILLNKYLIQNESLKTLMIGETKM